jgi:predicted TIM-barrel fold metal-dependent hydrolase
MIIDANTHITENGEWFGSGKNASVQSLIESLDLAGIERALALPIPGSISNKKVAEIVSAFPNRLIAGASFNPALYATAALACEAFESEFPVSKKSIIKFHNRFGNYSPLDERFLKTLDCNNNKPVPAVIAICGVFYNKHMNAEIVPPLYIFDLAKKFSRTNFMIMHGAGTWIMQTAEMVRDLANVFLDLSFVLSKYKGSSIENDIRWLCNNFDRRMIWGSDFPEYTVKEALNDFYEVTGGLSQAKKDNILGKNLMSLLNG